MNKEITLDDFNKSKHESLEGRTINNTPRPAWDRYKEFVLGPVKEGHFDSTEDDGCLFHHFSD